MGEKISVTFVKPGGTRETVEAETGESVMQAAVFNDVEGVEAECGGSCVCATCHVYLDEAAMKLAPAAEEDELAMLEDAAAEQRESSRLSCQIKLTPEMDGITVTIPETQY
ncbi:2Fe-2S iron-sulfur cluster-binding protein [Nisaea acidiphila]|uniref:2Fe-2S iron-sulfur cluster-binding protein n=1 Tax=Nisaea acidiphila TaxID=1862145 RepID=A0A9J7AQ33_9PROT|nr:2Fe-2S iron-sulfur cluster-binding protein [Nisaea acidiphila]UUX49335.1 2Fe-2S iron-sulfur cluster-binding protein [Nisaea acidiphila]